MRTIILAAGYATRLYPLTENYPKPLLDVGNKKIIEWLLDDVDQIEEIREHIIVTNHKFYDIFARWRQENAGRWRRPVHLIDDGTTDNDHRLGAVLDIATAVKEAPEADCLVLAGDNVLDFSFRGFVDFFYKKQASCVMCHREPLLWKRQKTGIIAVDEEDRILTMQEKPKNPVSDLAVPPFYCYRAGDLARLDRAVEEGCATDAPGSFVSWLCRQTDVYAYRMPGRRYDIGDMESYRNVLEQFEKGSFLQA